MATAVAARDDLERFVDPANWLGTLTYRSRARGRPTTGELAALVAQARQRNRVEGVTGMLLFDRGRFLQVLEGPPEGVEAVWRSIRADLRHDSIELLTQAVTPVRLFAGWDMQLFCRGGAAFRRALEQDLRAREFGPAILEVKDLALADDEEAIAQRVEALGLHRLGAPRLVSGLLEPAARALGDAWLADSCTDFALTLALGALQRVSHRLYDALEPPCRAVPAGSSILLASAPGEPHLTGPAFLADLFAAAGWATELAFPACDHELANRLAEVRPDALDIGLSEAMPRAHALAALKETIRSCRAASPKPGLVVSVGGRLFAERRASAADVGADHARTSAADAPAAIARLVERHRLACARGRTVPVAHEARPRA